MKKITWNGIKTIVKGWRMGDYIRQTSIVVIGVVVTFSGSNLITRCSEKEDIRSTMLLIRDELKRNREMFQYIVAEFREDERLSTLLVEHDMKYRTIPEDSLRQFVTVLGHIRSFSYTHNAFDILKNSMLMQRISDKEFLLSLTEVYEVLEGFKLTINGYYDIKEKITSPFHLSLTDEQAQLLHDGGYKTWEIYLSDRSMRNFLRMPQAYFTTGYLPRVEKRLDVMIQSLEKKYSLK